MRKALLISVMVCVLALGGIGAAFAAGMNINNVGILSLGVQDVPTVNADYVGFHLSSGFPAPVTVDGVYISLDKSISGTNAVSVSVRAQDGSELAYYAANNVNWDAGTIYQCNLSTDDGDPLTPPLALPTADQIYKVKVVVATNSQYN